jgi:K+ transporter
VSWIALKKAWIWIKHHWYVPVLLVLLVFSMLFGWKRNQALLDMLEATSESYKKQLDVINKAHKKEIDTRDDLITEYQATINSLEEEYEFKLGDLEKDKQQEVEEMVKIHKENPSALADEMKKLFDL